MTTKAALLVLSALAAAILTPRTQDPAKPAGAPFVLEAGDIELRDLVDKSAAYLKRNILVNEQETAMARPGALTIKLQQPISTDHDGCEDLLASMASTRGFAVVPLDEAKGVYEVISMNGPRNREVSARAPQRTTEQVLARPNLKMWVTTAVPLKHINATIATNALRPFFASTGAPSGSGSLTLGNVGNNSAILLSGMQDQVASAIRLLQQVDLPGERPAPGLAERLDQLTKRVTAIEEKLAAKEK